MTRVAIFSNHGPHSPELSRIFDSSFKTRLAANAQLFPHVLTKENFDEFAPQLREVEAIFSTWGMWDLSTAQLELLPNLKALFYAAGSVRHFAPALLTRGIIVTSSWQANAVPVAEWTLAHILLANKGAFRNEREYRSRADHNAFRGRGNYGATVSLLGAGQIGRRVIEFLRPFNLNVLVFDPFLPAGEAQTLGVEKVELDEAFRRGDVVSNHLADLPSTERMIRGVHLNSMPPDATFINTGRGRTLDHDELLEVFSRRDDLTALLDVTDPEPLPLSHPLRDLFNVHLTSHIAGSIGDEVARMGEYALSEFERWQLGESLHFAVTLEMLETMA